MDVISPELPQFMRLIIALAIVLGLMGGLSLLLKKLGLSTQAAIKSGKDKRLEIVESLPLDARRRLAIVKCDEKEHLIVLGANSELLIDKNIDPVDSSTDTGKNT